MDSVERRVFYGLVVLCLGSVILLGFGYDRIDWGSRDTGEPFIKDRVVKIHIVMDEKAWERIRTNARAKEYERADFWFDGQKYPNVAIRAKGMSSLNSVASSGSSRISFKVDFNFFNFAQTFRGLKKLCLNNGFSDPTLIRETLGYEAFEEMGLPTPRTAFVDLYVNDDHIGVYTQVEPIDKTFIERHFANAGGNLYKPEIGAASLNWTKENAESQGQTTTGRGQENDLLAINMGGGRLSDLLRLMQKEAPSYDPNEDAAVMGGWGGFPGGPGGGGPGGGFPGGFGGPGGGFAGGPQGGFGGPGGGFGPGGQFPGDANNMQAGGFPGGPGGFGGPEGGFAGGPQGGFGGPGGGFGPGGQFPGDANNMQAGGFPGGPGGFGGPEGGFAGGPQGGFGGPGGGFGPGGQFPGDANNMQAGGFPGGPGGFGGPGGGFAGGPQGGFGGPGGGFGPGGQFPGDMNDMQAGGFPGGFGGRGGGFAFDPNSRRSRGGRGFGGQGGPGGFGGPGRGGPGGGGPFGRGGGLIETAGLRTNENYEDHTALFKLLEVLNKCPDESFPTEIEKVLDVDQVLRYFAVSVMIVHLDNYIGLCHNFYLYEVDGKFTILPWDLNMAFGGFGMGMGGSGDSSDYQIDNITNLTDRPLAGRLLSHKPYLDRYHAYLEEMLRGCMAEGVMESRIDEIVAMIRPYVEADMTKSFTMDDFDKGLNEGGARGGMMGGPRFGPGAGVPTDANSTTANTGRQSRDMGRGGRGGRGGGPGGPGGGPGLKSFFSKRRISVRKQLDGELPTKSESQGFGGMMGGPGMGGRR